MIYSHQKEKWLKLSGLTGVCNEYLRDNVIYIATKKGQEGDYLQVDEKNLLAPLELALEVAKNAPIET